MPASPIRFKPIGLSGKTMALAAAAAALVSVGPWIGHAMHQKADVKTRAEHIVLRAADGLVRLGSQAIETNDVAAMRSGASLIARDPALDAVAIFDPDGQVLAQAGDGQPLGASSLAKTLLSSGAGTLTSGAQTLGALSVTAGGETIGVVMIRAQHSGFKAGGAGPLTHFGLTLLSLILLMPGVLLTARTFPAPTAGLVAALQRVRPGGLEQAASTVEGEVDIALKNTLVHVGRQYDTAFKRARKLALQDPISKLPNRNRFISVLDSWLSKGVEMTVLIADLDGFRKVNEMVGPRSGDEVLGQIAARLHTALRTADRNARPGACKHAPSFLARLGADQFGLIIPDADRAIAERMAQLVASAIAQPVKVDGRTVGMSASFGGAAAPRDANSAIELLKLGEVALKNAKRENSGQAVFYDVSLLKEIEAQAKLEDDLRRAVSRGEFVAVFQPKVHLDSGEIIGAEALARWRRPDGSVVSPGVFIPKAEEMGLISQLGISVLKDACEAAASWNSTGRRCRIAVNVSPLQFEDPDFIPSVYETLDQTGLDPELLELEITESAAINDHERVARIMRPLRARGVRLSIDDFGTGHSNFTTVTRLPFDVFKIDQQFVRALSEDPHAPAIVEMILAMAETLGQETVAEGVETAEQADFLRRRACTVGQGYFFSPPLPCDEFVSFLSSWRPEQKKAAVA